MNHESPTRTGETVGRYELISRIATGGMAEIFLARERGLAGLERLVVIKRILPHLVHEPSFVDMFLREARIIARLNHPNIVQIYELGEVDGAYFLALEYIDGCSLRELQTLSERRDEPVSLDVALSIVAAACRGAHAAHELADADGRPLGLVHRDISPHNLMVTPRGHVKLLDFGVAKAAEGFEATSSGNLKGKYAYMSPEQCLHEPLDRRSDIFALGIVLWELCAGRRLYDQRTEIEILHAIVHDEAPDVRTAAPDVPPEIAEVVARALAREPDDRHASAEALRHALLDAARRASIALDGDAIGPCVERIAGRHLARRHEILERAREQTLNSVDARRLTRVTATGSEVVARDEATIAARPSASTSTGQRRARDVADALARSRNPDGELDAATTGPGPDDPVDAATTGPEPLHPHLDGEPDARPTAPELPAGKLPPPPTPSRRPTTALLIVAALAVAGALAWWFASSTADTDAEPGTADGTPPVVLSGEPLVVAWAPTVDVEILRDELEPLRTHLERVLETPVRFEYTADYRDLADRVVSGEFAYGVFPPMLFTRASQRQAGLELVAVKEFDGATTSDGYLLVPQAGAIDDVDDLRGKRMCLTDPDSTTGYFLPRAWLRRQGHDPDAFFSSVHFSRSHLQVMRDLLAGLCDAAATYNGAYLTANSYGIASGRLRVLAITGNIPQDVIVAGPGADPERTRRLRDSLLSLSPPDDLNLPRIGDNQRITGFDAADESMFDDLRQALTASHTGPRPPHDDASESDN